MNNLELSKMHYDFLKQNGYKASIDEKNDVSFFYKGNNYSIAGFEGDDEYFSIINVVLAKYPDENLIDVILQANMSTLEHNLGKVIYCGDILMFIVGIWLKKPEDFKHFFKKALTTIVEMQKQFFDEMEKKE